MATTAIRRRIGGQPQSDLWGFLLFSHGWTWIWWSINVLAGYDAFGQGLLFTVLGGIGPLLSGIVMAYVTYGSRGLTDLWQRLIDPGRIQPRWAAVTILFFPVVTILTALVAGIITGQSFPLNTTLDELARKPVSLLTTALVIPWSARCPRRSAGAVISSIVARPDGQLSRRGLPLDWSGRSGTRRCF